MDYTEKEMIINRIVSGISIYTIDGVEYIYRQPTRIEKCRADSIYTKTLIAARQRAISNEDYLESMMKSKGYWTDKDEDELEKLSDQLDKMKIMLYENFSKKEADGIRKKIKTIKDAIEDFSRRKYEYTAYTDKWVATCARQRYLISCSIGSDLETIIDIILSFMREESLSEGEFREIARSEPWRSIWETRVVGDLFGVPACDLTPDQTKLVLYSVMYDRIGEHPERPHEDIIDDDDALDGWKLVQKHNIEKDRADREIDEKISNRKIAGAQEIIIPVETDEELQAVNNRNDPAAKIIKRNREHQVVQHGVVAHENFIDQQLLIREGLRNRK